MKEITVFGSGCTKCVKTAESIAAIAQEKSVAIELKKETSAEAIMLAGIMRTPAVMVDGVVVHSGSIPHRDDIEQWLA